MHSAIILALAAFTGLAVAAPQPQTTSVPAPPSGIYTNTTVSDGFPTKLKARGYHDDSCTECPPEPPTCDRYKGCLYIKCSDYCEEENCCECIGLEPEKPYFLYYDSDPSGYPPNLQVNSDYYHQQHDFYYDDTDKYFYLDETSEWGIELWEEELALTGSYPLQKFYYNYGEYGLVTPEDYCDYEHFWVCKVDDYLRVYYSEEKPCDYECCPVKLYFTDKESEGYKPTYGGKHHYGTKTSYYPYPKPTYKTEYKTY